MQTFLKLLSDDAVVRSKDAPTYERGAADADRKVDGGVGGTFF